MIDDVAKREWEHAVMLSGAPQILAQTILDTLREPLLVLDVALQVKMANRSFYRTFRLKAEETLNKFIYELGDGQWNIPKLRLLLEEICFGKTQVEDFEVERDFAGIGRRFLVLNARRIQPETGQPMIILALEDISERKEIQRELERSNRDLEQFAYVASHDLQEPLRVVTSFTQLLAKRLINDLLEYARLGSHEAEFGATDCEAVLADAVSNLGSAIEESGATVTHDPLPNVMADRDELNRLFQNLLSNAIKFHAADPPVVHVSARRNENEWLFSVRDNGIGIDPEHFEHVFLIFKRLHGMSEYSGTGVGLAICRKIVEHHGGEIWIESQAGKGSTFYFTMSA